VISDATESREDSGDQLVEGLRLEGLPKPFVKEERNIREP